MKKVIKLLVAIMLTLLPSAAYAYNVVDLPEEMTMSDAMGIFSGYEVQRATISNVGDGQYIELSRDEINDFYYSACNMTVYRTINPTPFRGTAINLYTETDVVSYYVGSGIQVGTYGTENYVCYKVKGEDEVFLTYLDSKYKDSELKMNGEEIHRATDHDFLKLPDAEWAKSPVKEAAKHSILPYRLTSKYTSNISREEFCILLGQLLTVAGGYSDLDAYIQDRQGAYLMNAFDDCEGKDVSIDILSTLGIVNGKGDNMFDPDGTLSREEAAKMIAAAAEQFVYISTSKQLEYTDRKTISSWAYYAVQWVTDNEIMTGMENNTFSPHSYYTVEQAIATVNRLYNYLDKMLV